MNKCFKCGCEFDGNFCPKCGSKYEKEKTCPNCNAVVDGGVSFCNNCGYSFEREAAETPIVKPKKASAADVSFSVWNVLAKVLPKVSTYALALFSLLLWAFFAAPFASMFGVSLGNVYTTINGTFDDFLPVARASLAFGVICLLYAAATVTLSFVPKTAKAVVGKTDLIKLMSVCGNVFYAPFFALGCAAIAKSKEIGAEKGSFAGVIIAFSVVFAVLSVGSVIADLLLRRKASAYSDAVNAAVQAQKEREERRINLLAERKANAVAALSEQGLDQPAAIGFNASTTSKIKTAYDVLTRNLVFWLAFLISLGVFYILIYTYMLILSNAGKAVIQDYISVYVSLVFAVINTVLLVFALCFFLNGYKVYLNKQSKMSAVKVFLWIYLVCNIGRLLFILLSTGTAVSLLINVWCPEVYGTIVSLIFLGVLTSGIDNEEYLQLTTVKTIGKLYATGFWIALACSLIKIVITLLIASSGSVGEYERNQASFGSLMATVISAIPILVFLIIYWKKSKRFISSIERQDSVSRTVDSQSDGENKISYLSGLCREMENYDKYKQESRYYAYRLRKASCNVANAKSREQYAKTPRLNTVIAVMLVAILLIYIAAVVVWDVQNIFKESKVKQISNGMTKDEVAKILGKTEFASEYSWNYYSSNFVELTREAQKLSEQMANAQDLEQAVKIQQKIDELQVKIKNTTYKYITVTFDSDGKVINVQYDFEFKPNGGKQAVSLALFAPMYC